MTAKQALHKTGYRQRQVLHALHASHTGTVKAGYLRRRLEVDGKTLHVALKGLEKRGLVTNPCHGVWGLS